MDKYPLLGRDMRVASLGLDSVLRPWNGAEQWTRLDRLCSVSGRACRSLVDALESRCTVAAIYRAGARRLNNHLCRGRYQLMAAFHPL